MLRCSLLLLSMLAVLCLAQAAPQKVSSTPNNNNPSQSKQQIDPKCLLPKEPGPCRMSLDRYFYNPQSNACELFKFGGCRGNDNRFGHIGACEEACVQANKAAANAATTPSSVAAAPAKTPANAPASKAAAGAPPAGVVDNKRKTQQKA